MLFGRERVTLFLGNFGSGKTEVAVNFAMHLATGVREGAAGGGGEAVSLVDLDLVNPYFRSREPMAELMAHGVRVILPDAQYMHADLPILAPEVRAALMASTSHVILDVGGDDVGARVVGALNDALPSGSYRALMVLNGNRPQTRDLAGISRIRSEIERAARIEVTGFVSNTHLMGETTAATVLGGYRLARDAAAEAGLPLEFVTAPPDVVEEVAREVACEILPLRRALSVPWLRQEERGGGRALFRL